MIEDLEHKAVRVDYSYDQYGHYDQYPKWEVGLV